MKISMLPPAILSLGETSAESRDAVIDRIINTTKRFIYRMSALRCCILDKDSFFIIDISRNVAKPGKYNYILCVRENFCKII